MTKEELAQKLNNITYKEEMPKEYMALAKAQGLVVMYGFSDDLVEMEGALNDEASSMYEGGFLYVDKEGIVPERDEEESDDDVIVKWATRRKRSKKVKATLDTHWTFETKIPHAKFNIVDEGSVQCEAIVFSIKDL